jgi:hypothetical protein
MPEGDEREVTEPNFLLTHQSGPNISAQEPLLEDSSSLENKLEDREDNELRDFHAFEESLVS